MKTQIRVLDNLEGFNSNNPWILSAEPENLHGKYSESFYIELSEQNPNVEDNWISIELNKNEARYLAHALLAFADERKD